VEPLCADIVAHAAANWRHSPEADEPLALWFGHETGSVLRSLERAIQQVLVSGTDYQLLTTAQALAPLSSLAAVFYAALFEVARNLAGPYRTSNPTWVRMPRDEEPRVTADASTIFRLFLSASRRLAIAVSASSGSAGPIQASVLLGDSAQLPLADSSVDAIVSSPPYCTRIDYVIATSVELAVLGVGRSGLRALRSQMMGTPTISTAQNPADGFGEIATSLLSKVSRHKSRASATYYYKYFVQYFSKMAASFAELRRVAKPASHLVLVVQDSYYKEVHVDLQGIVTDLGQSTGWNLVKRIDFQAAHTMAAVNPRARVYREYFGATESALVFKGD
jgi:hypothetical protein